MPASENLHSNGSGPVYSITSSARAMNPVARTPSPTKVKEQEPLSAYQRDERVQQFAREAREAERDDPAH